MGAYYYLGLVDGVRDFSDMMSVWRLMPREADRDSVQLSARMIQPPFNWASQIWAREKGWLKIIWVHHNSSGASADYSPVPITLQIFTLEVSVGVN